MADEMRERGGITRNPQVMGGAYCLAGHRMPVVQVKRMMRDSGADWIKREFPWITEDQINDALAFRAKVWTPVRFTRDP